MGALPVVARGVNHFFGEAPVRKQVLFDVTLEVREGEIMIVTGPSGSGKTTLLTLIGGLRSTEAGSLQVFGRELRGATERTLVEVRKSIGYIFQAHNLLESLSAAQNVEMSLALHQDQNGARRERARATLAAVGLAEHAERHVDQLSGGQKQRVAIARALAATPRLILADEPTASLDRQTGRDVAEIMQRLAREHECTVLLVTHDNRILDVADRIVHVEDGRLTSFTNAVMTSTQHLMSMLALNNRKGELSRQLSELPVDQFASLLEQVTGEFQQLLRVLSMSGDETFESMIEQVIEAFTLKIGHILQADRVSLFLVDEARGELWSKVAQHDGGEPLDIRFPIGTGLAGRAARTGERINTAAAHDEPDFNSEIDARTGYRTESMLCLPLKDRRGRTFAVAQLLNKRGAARFADADERRFQELATSIGVILESWWEMSVRRDAVLGRTG